MDIIDSTGLNINNKWLKGPPQHLRLVYFALLQRDSFIYSTRTKMQTKMCRSTSPHLCRTTRKAVGVSRWFLCCCGWLGGSGSRITATSQIHWKDSIPAHCWGVRVGEKHRHLLQRHNAGSTTVSTQSTGSSRISQVGKCLHIKVCSLFLPSLTWQALRLNQTVIIY